MSDTLLKLQEAVVLLGRFPALSGVNLEVGEGETVMITGANGAGKTTLLRLLAGLIRIKAGAGNVLGVDLNGGNLRNLRSKVGLLGQQSMLYEDLTVLENLKFYRGIWLNEEADPETDVEKQNEKSTDEVVDALNYLELKQDFWNTPVRLLSTGQKRRASLALQVIRRPNLWLLDEPHASLDKAGRDLLDEIMKRAADSGAAVVFASHEIERTQHLADRHLELVGGRFK